ncbi:MAG: N-acetyl-gamma-glutamyl-phosphate reductase [Phycisphaerae bacterium]
MINVAIIGASGYTGLDAIEIINRHPQAQLTYLTALPQECGHAEQVFGRLKGKCDMQIEPLDLDKLAKAADVVLCCLPHKVSMGFVPKLLDAGVKIVDFSADYRIKDVKTYEQFYKVEHTDTDNLKKAVYGLPELFRDEIKGKKLIANPGCFPTGLLLAIAPLLKEGLIETESIIDNAVTGTSGAGKNPSVKFHFPNMNENFFAYGIGFHRHTPEMEEVATKIAGQKVTILFQPHVGPFDRGILSTIYCRPKKSLSQQTLDSLYEDFYKDEQFVQLCSESPNLKNIAGTNYCHIHVTQTKGKIAAFSAIDNLVKGASGQAIQNMNIIFGLDETLGLK